MDDGWPHSQPPWFQRGSIIPRHPRHSQCLTNVSSIQRNDDTLSLTPSGFSLILLAQRSA